MAAECVNHWATKAGSNVQRNTEKMADMRNNVIPMGSSIAWHARLRQAPKWTVIRK